MDLARALIREPDVTDAADYRRRVRHLAWIFPALFAVAATGLVLLIQGGRFFVTLAQRSNVETLTIAFFILFFTYLVVLTSRGAVGGMRIGWYHLAATFARDPRRVERKKLAALGPATQTLSVALSHALERADRPGQPFVLRIADEVGAMGRLRIDGVRVDHLDAHRDGSNNLFAYFLRQVADVTGTPVDDVEIVQWKAIDDEEWHQYVSSAHALRALGRRLGGDEPVWPSIRLTAAQCEELEHRLGAVCASLRDEAFLPHWEFEGEHKVPIIPEPLGIISLSRKERRVDPLSSMTTALIVVAAAVALIAWFMVRPPWVPGR